MNRYKAPHFHYIFLMYLQHAKQLTSLQQNKQNNLGGKKLQASLKNRVILALSKSFLPRKFWGLLFYEPHMRVISEVP